jgi:CRP/FNR family transcriptional regulator
LIRIKNFVFYFMAQNPAFPITRSDFFQALSPENKVRLEDICVPKTLKRRDVLFREGDKGYAVFFCARGSIRLYKTAPSGQEVVIKVAKPGELFAEAILFERDRYPVTASALENSLVYLLPKPQFDCLLEDPDFRNDFIANLMGKLRYLAEQVQSLTSDDAETRLFRFLKERFGQTDEIRTHLSKKDVAAAIGTTPETLSRLLQKLKETGILKWKEGTIRIRS